VCCTRTLAPGCQPSLIGDLRAEALTAGHPLIMQKRTSAMRQARCMTGEQITCVVAVLSPYRGNEPADHIGG
jgi:hypothetical protein